MPVSTEPNSTFAQMRVVVGVAIVCAAVVSTTAVTLRPHYLANLEAARMARLALIVDALSTSIGPVSVEDLEANVVELSSGKYDSDVDPLTFDSLKLANDPKQSVTIPDHEDVAGIKSRATHELVFVVRHEADVAAIILPVRGSGYQSTLKGYLALDGLARTVLALNFYEQGETPGLGARVQESAWEALWPGVEVYDATGVLRIGVSRPGGDSRSYASHRVDGISGATRTSLGVDALLRFWLGDFGFGPYLQRVRAGEV